MIVDIIEIIVVKVLFLHNTVLEYVVLSTFDALF